MTHAGVSVFGELVLSWPDGAAEARLWLDVRPTVLSLRTDGPFACVVTVNAPTRELQLLLCQLLFGGADAAVVADYLDERHGDWEHMGTPDNWARVTDFLRRWQRDRDTEPTPAASKKGERP